MLPCEKIKEKEEYIDFYLQNTNELSCQICSLHLLFFASSAFLFLKNFFSTFLIYFWDRERQSMNGGGAEREGDTESETGSRL